MYFGIIKQIKSSSSEELNEELDGAGHAVEVETSTAVARTINPRVGGEVNAPP